MVFVGYLVFVAFFVVECEVTYGGLVGCVLDFLE